MKIISTLAIFLCGLTVYGQQLKDEKEIYDILIMHNLGDKTRIESARIAFQQFIVSNPKSNFKLTAMFYLAEIADRSGKTDSATLLYNEVLSMRVPDSIDRMNCRNRSAKRLAEIYMANGDFCSAINYLDLAQFMFIPRFSCGNAYSQNNLEMKVLYAGCYTGQGDYQKAIDSLAPFMFANIFAPNTILVKKLYDTYLKVYSKEEIRNEFLSVEKRLEIRKETYYSYNYLRALITVFDCEIEVPCYDYDFKKLTEEQQIQRCMERIRRSGIYKLSTTE